MPMGMTIAEKILASHSRRKEIKPGDVVVVDIDVIVDMDIAFGITGGHPMPTRVCDPDKIVLVADHTVPAPSIEAANALKRMREFAAAFGIRRFLKEGQHGISHVVIAESGLALPSQTLACDDSHSCSSGALNCLARGVGLADMMYIICKGQTWFGADGEIPCRRPVAGARVAQRYHSPHRRRLRRLPRY